MLNASQHDREFLYPSPEMAWSLEIDSAYPDFRVGPEKVKNLLVTAHSAVLLGASIKL
jgi:hypothetical protein